MKIVEVIILIIFTLIALIILVQFLSRSAFFFEKKNEKEVISSKDVFLFKIEEYLLSCFEKNRERKKQELCKHILYIDEKKITKKEIFQKLSDIGFEVVIEFEDIYSKDEIFIIFHPEEKIILKKVKDIVIS